MGIKHRQLMVQLARRYSRNYVTLTEFRTDYMPHINNNQHLGRVLNDHPVKLKISRLHSSQRAERIVFLTDLAEWLVRVETAATAA